MASIIQFLKDDDGVTSVEYAVMLALIIAVCIVTLKSLGNSTNGMWANNNDEMIKHGF